ncbi:MAG: serine hydrolase [Weeksellaceae bacterium]|nr:serine hydrolase [Weeksellaceae bacterium]
MRSIFVLLFIVLPFFSFAQKENHLKAYQNFRKDFNSKDFNAIYQSFTPAMQKHMAYQGLERFLMDLRFKAGPIETYEFIKYEDDKLASFRSDFNINSYKIDISVDKNDRINGLFVNPYNGPKKAPVVNSLAHKQNNVIEAIFSKSNPIVDLIYSHTKYLPNNSQLSIALINKDKTEFFGVKKENDTINSIENQNNNFEIGSISQVLTSSVLASLITDNKLKLSDEINQFYPFEFKDNHKITFQELANHTSGLGKLSLENKVINDTINPTNLHQEKLYHFLRHDLKIDNVSSKSYVNSDFGTELLSLSLGSSQNTTFQKLLQDNILSRYHMTKTILSKDGLNSELAKNSNDLVPNFSIFSTVVDLEKFIRAQFNSSNKDLALTQHPTFEVNKNKSIGLGWNIMKKGRDILYLNDIGTAGNSSSIILNANKQTAIIILSNVPISDERASNIHDLAEKLEKINR